MVVAPGGVPLGFEILRNGEALPKAAWGVAVETDPGDVTIEASGPRLVPFKKVVTLAEGAQERVDVEAKRVPTAVITLALKTRPSGVSIALDGAPVDLADTGKPREVDVGEHAVTVEAPGYMPFRWKKDLNDSDAETVEVVLHAEPQAQRGTPKWLFVATTAGAVVLLGTATALAMDAQSTSNSQQALDPLLRSQSQKNDVGTLSTAANVLFVTGGVLGLGAGVLLFTTKWQGDLSPQARAAVAPWLGPGSGGLAVTGRF